MGGRGGEGGGEWGGTISGNKFHILGRGDRGGQSLSGIADKNNIFLRWWLKGDFTAVFKRENFLYVNYFYDDGIITKQMIKEVRLRDWAR